MTKAFWTLSWISSRPIFPTCSWQVLTIWQARPHCPPCTSGMSRTEGFGRHAEAGLISAGQPWLQAMGDRLHNMALDFIGRHPDAMLVIHDIRGGRSTMGFSADVSTAFRKSWFQILGTDKPPPCSGPDPTVLETWGKAVGDVDASPILPQ